MNTSYIFSKRNAGRRGVVWLAAVSFLLWTSTGYAAYFQGGPSGGSSVAEGRPETNSEETASAPAPAPTPAKAEVTPSVSTQTAADPAPKQ